MTDGQWILARHASGAVASDLGFNRVPEAFLGTMRGENRGKAVGLPPI